MYIWLIRQNQFVPAFFALIRVFSGRSLAFLSFTKIYFSFTVISGSSCSSTAGSNDVF